MKRSFRMLSTCSIRMNTSWLLTAALSAGDSLGKVSSPNATGQTAKEPQTARPGSHSPSRSGNCGSGLVFRQPANEGPLHVTLSESEGDKGIRGAGPNTGRRHVPHRSAESHCAGRTILSHEGSLG